MIDFALIVGPAALVLGTLAVIVGVVARSDDALITGAALIVFALVVLFTPDLWQAVRP